MNNRRIILGLAWILLSVLAKPAAAIDGGRLGDVAVVEPKGPPRGLVVLYSDRTGWTAEEERAAQSLAEAGVLVVEVDTPRYVANVVYDKEPCHWASGDAEQLSRRLQRERGWGTYLAPIMAGIGEGGTLARVALAQAPPSTFAGAVSIDPTPSVTGQHPFCNRATPVSAGNGFRYGPMGPLPGFWSVGLTTAALPEARGDLRELRRQGVPFEISKLTGLPDQGRRMALLVEERLGAVPATELPLVELPVQQSSRLMAVILSGDGGWRDIDKSIADYFHRQGIPVVGLDSLHYFWNRKTPERTAADVATVLERYRDRWHADKVALIGYSFGADVLPFVYNRLPAAERAHVSAMALLGLSHRTDFEVHVQGWKGRGGRRPACRPRDQANSRRPRSMLLWPGR